MTIDQLSIWKVEEWVRDYNWMKKEIVRLQKVIRGGTVPMKAWGVAQYGIEAVMPKGSSGKSSLELEQMDIREEKQIRRLEKYESIVYALETAFDVLQDERQKIIYDCLLEEMTYRQIALHLSMSKDYVQRQKKEIVRQIGQSRQIQSILTGRNSA